MRIAAAFLARMAMRMDPRPHIADAAPASLALLAFTLLIAFAAILADIARTSAEAQARLSLAANLMAANFSQAPAQTGGLAAASFPDAAVADSQSYVIDGAGRVLMTTDARFAPAAPFDRTALMADGIYVETALAGTGGRLALSLPQAQMLGPVMGRGALALLAALVVSALGWRRRQRPATIDAAESLIDSIPFGVALWGGNGRLAIANAQFHERLKLDALDLRAGTQYRHFSRKLLAVGASRTVAETEQHRLIEHQFPDDTYLLIDERPIADGGFVTLVTDVTDRKKTDLLLTSIRQEQRFLTRQVQAEKQRAEAASRSKSSFLAHLSHDIRTPLNHIIGFADLIRHQTYGPIGDRRYLNYLEDIKKSGETLLSAFSQILELVELEGGTRALNRQDVPVATLFRQIADRHAARCRAGRVRLSLSAPADTVLAADRLSLERMIGNIVDNAIRFTRPGGEVRLSAHEAEDGLVIEISDTGCGMSPAQLDAIAEPFALGDAAFAREHPGPGLGIAIARAIAVLHGGQLAVDSTQGVGTTVAISLPHPAKGASAAAA